MVCLFYWHFLAEQDMQGLFNNLQDWELALKGKDKKMKSQAGGKETLVITYFITYIFISTVLNDALVN